MKITKSLLAVAWFCLLFHAAAFSYAYTDSEISDDLFTYAHNYYKLEETGFDYVSEVYGSLYFTGGVAPTRSSCKINYGQTFDGVNDILNTAFSESMEMQNMLICYWLYSPNNATSKPIMELGRYVADGDRNGISMSLNSLSKLRAYTYHSGSLQNRWDSAVLSGNTWYHVCASFGVMAGETEAKPKIWINGALSGALLTDLGTPNTISYTAGTTTQLFLGGTNYYNSLAYGNTIIDELYIGSGFGKWNISHAQFLYDSASPGENQQYPFLYDYSPPVITLNYPVNNSHIFWNGSLSVNVSDADIGQDHSCIFNISGSSYLVDNTDYPTFTISGLSPVNGVYDWNVTCFDWKNTTHLYGNFIHDSVNPALIVYKPVNKSVINKINISTVNFTIHVRDLYLWKVNTTITGPGGLFFNNYSGELNAEWFNLTEIFPTSNMSVGNYTVRIEAADTHTAAEFKEKVIIQDKKLIMEKGVIEFKLPSGASMQNEKQKDRIVQKFDFKKAKGDYKYSVAADNIRYLPDSAYPCHFIINDRYWYDCIGLDSPKVSKKAANEYEISFSSVSGLVETHSLGGLNMVNFTGWFYITTIFTPPIHTDTTIGYVYSTANNTALPGAAISVYVYNHQWINDTVYITDALGRALIGFTPGYNYTFIVSKPGYESKNISIGEIIYPEYAIGLTLSGVTMTPTLIMFFAALSMIFFFMSLWAQRISIYIMAGVLLIAVSLFIWPLSAVIGLIYVLCGLYAIIQIVI
jgi:hypothetical protein